MTVALNISDLYSVIQAIYIENKISIENSVSLEEEVKTATQELCHDLFELNSILERLKVADSPKDVLHLLVDAKINVMGISTIFDNLADELKNLIIRLQEWKIWPLNSSSHYQPKKDIHAKT